MKNQKTDKNTYGDTELLSNGFPFASGTETPPKAEATKSPETPLSREKLHGNYGTLIGESTGHLKGGFSFK